MADSMVSENHHLEGISKEATTGRTIRRSYSSEKDQLRIGNQRTGAPIVCLRNRDNIKALSNLRIWVFSLARLSEVNPC